MGHIAVDAHAADEAALEAEALCGGVVVDLVLGRRGGVVGADFIVGEGMVSSDAGSASGWRVGQVARTNFAGP